MSTQEKNTKKPVSTKQKEVEELIESIYQEIERPQGDNRKAETKSAVDAAFDEILSEPSESDVSENDKQDDNKPKTVKSKKDTKTSETKKTTKNDNKPKTVKSKKDTKTSETKKTTKNDTTDKSEKTTSSKKDDTKVYPDPTAINDALGIDIRNVTKYWHRPSNYNFFRWLAENSKILSWSDTDLHIYIINEWVNNEEARKLFTKGSELDKKRTAHYVGLCSHIKRILASKSKKEQNNSAQKAS